MGSPRDARHSDRTSPIHRARRAHAAAARVHQKIAKDTKGRPRSRPATPPRVEEEGLNPVHIGSDFQEFLKEEGLLEEVQLLAVKELLAYRIQELMREARLTKDALAKRMRTSRAALDRLLDPANPSVTLVTLGKAACALKRTLRIELL
jgi:antitoxin HicB